MNAPPPCPRCRDTRAVGDADEGLRCASCNALLVAFAPRDEHSVRFYACDGSARIERMTKRPFVLQRIVRAGASPDTLTARRITWERYTYAYRDEFVGPWRDPDYHEQPE